MTGAILEPEAVTRFSDDARRAVYDVIALRRDVRHFVKGADVDGETVERILQAGHLAPSVGFSQPWGFVVVRDHDRRSRIRESFLLCREAEANRFPAERRAQYLSYRLEGLLDAPVNVCVAVDLRPQGEAILGTTVQPEAVRASACCAVQNLWLAASSSRRSFGGSSACHQGSSPSRTSASAILSPSEPNRCSRSSDGSREGRSPMRCTTSAGGMLRASPLPRRFPSRSNEAPSLPSTKKRATPRGRTKRS
jgi:5,6-dimethylbenzimidazole synthase